MKTTIRNYNGKELAIFLKGGLKLQVLRSEIWDAKAVKAYAIKKSSPDPDHWAGGGWVSSTLCYHSNARKQRAIDHAEKIAQLIYTYRNEIASWLIELGKSIDNIVAVNVDDRIAHPKTRKEKNEVKKFMQAHAPIGTNHL